MSFVPSDFRPDGSKRRRLKQDSKNLNLFDSDSVPLPFVGPLLPVISPVPVLTDYQVFCSQSSDLLNYERRLASGPAPFHSYEQQHLYFKKRRNALLYGVPLRISDEPSPSQRLGFKTRQYISGELTGACFFSGCRSTSSPPPPRVGPLESTEFTTRARIKIRRASECSPVDLKYFITLTFAPSHLLPWQLLPDGTVRHDFAKYRIKKFLNTCSVMSYRKDRQSFVGPVCSGHDVLRLQYIWVAELQKNGNIHFHILLDRFLPIAWLSEVWGQAKNSVDVKRLDNPRHAVNYMRKYMTKDETSLISGNRYFITRGLHNAMKPDETIISASRPDPVDSVPWGEGVSIRSILHDMKTDIERAGGSVLDFGFSCPAPRRSRLYRDKKSGESKKSRGVSSLLAPFVLSAIALAVPSSLPF